MSQGSKLCWDGTKFGHGLCLFHAFTHARRPGWEVHCQWAAEGVTDRPMTCWTRHFLLGLSPDRCSGSCSVRGRLIVVAQVRRDIRRIGSFAGLFFSRFSKPNTAATAVLVDELDACGFQRQT